MASSTFSLLALFVLAASTLGGASAAGLPEPFQRAAALVESVDDPDFRSRLKLEMVEHFLLRGWRDEAATLAASVPDYRRGIALAKVATHFARVGEKARVGPLLEQALAQTGFPHEWHRDAIRAEVAVAWVAAGEAERAAEISTRISEEGAVLQARAGRIVERARRGEPWDATELDPPTDVKKLAPELLLLARATIEIAELRMAEEKPDREAIAALCRQSEALVRACKATAGEELLATGLLWRRLGDMKKSAEILGLALHHLPPGVELQGWRTGYFARLVGVYVEAGEKERVQAMLAAGRKGIAPLHAFYQPLALCQLAEAELAAGLPEQAEATWAEAVAVALGNPNPGSKYLGAAQVAFSIGRTGREIPGKIVQQLAPLAPQAQPATER